MEEFSSEEIKSLSREMKHRLTKQVISLWIRSLSLKSEKSHKDFLASLAVYRSFVTLFKDHFKK